MATLKEHQAAMVDLLANGSGIPASASRLAHAMHDLLGVVMLQSAARENAVDIRMLFGLDDATTPGLNDKAISKREKALKTDSHAEWPTPAEQRVKELENTIRQLKANNAKLKRELIDLGDNFTKALSKLHTAEEQLGRGLRGIIEHQEQAGCRKPDVQVCEHDWVATLQDDFRTCSKCHREELI